MSIGGASHLTLTFGKPKSQAGQDMNLATNATKNAGKPSPSANSKSSALTSDPPLPRRCALVLENRLEEHPLQR
jgi:hypothetical protein